MAAALDGTPERDEVAEATVHRAAALDDYLGGFVAADGGRLAPSPSLDEVAREDVAGVIDTILLLRQAAAADGVVPKAVPAEAPRSIGRHAILRRAGEGGFATVWEGFDTVLRRSVAVKVRRPEALLSETARRRFLREAEIAARLVHPHIVTIYEVGEDQGREFIAAEFCRCGSLAAWLERHPGPVPPRTAALLVRALAGAVASAHDMGIVHRDIKPANVLLVPAPPGTTPILRESPDAPGLTVKLGDFGLGKVEGDEALGEPLTQLTRSGTSIGTPAWMAPEQVDRAFGQVGPATDVHGLGLLLDRLLTGRALRSGGTTAETYRQVLLDETPSADRVARGVPRDLSAVCMKCLAKRPAGRYPTAAALAADLDRWLDGRPTSARPLSTVGRATRWVSHRPIVAGLGLVAVAASLVAAWAGMERLRERQVSARHEDEIRRRSAATELRRGFEALRAGNVAGALEQLDRTRAVDPALANSLAGRWLVRRAHDEREILLAPDAARVDASQPRDLFAIALSSDGKTAAVAGADGRVRLLHGLDGLPSSSAVAAHDEVNAVAFSPDGGLLATVGQDGRLRWWTVTGAGLVAAGEAVPGTGPLYAVAFTPDGRSIATGGEERVVRLVPLDSPDRPTDLFRFEQPPGAAPEVESIAFVDERVLAASCGDRVVLLDAADGHMIRELESPVDHASKTVVGSLAVSTDRDRVLGCGTDARAHVWSVATGRIVTSLPAHPAWVQGCCFVAGGTRVATACRDGGLRIFDSATGAPEGRLFGHVGRVWSVTAEPAGTLLTCGADGTVRRWDPRADHDTAALRTVPVDAEIISRVTEGRRPDERQSAAIVALDSAGLLKSVGPAGAATRLLVPERFGHGIEIAVDDARRRLAVSWREDQPVAVIDLEASAVRTPAAVTLPDTIAPRQALPCWTPTDDLVVCARDGALGVVSPDLSRAVAIDSPLQDPVHALAAAPRGAARMAAAGVCTAIVHIPDVAAATPAPPPLILEVGEESSACAWSPDADIVVCGTRTGRITLFDAASGAARGALVPHEQKIEAVAFTGDGRILLTADRGCVRISDVETLTTLDEIRPGWILRNLRLTADDRCLLVAGHADGRPGAGTARLAVMDLGRP